MRLFHELKFVGFNTQKGFLEAIPCNLGEWQVWDIGKKEWYTNKAVRPRRCRRRVLL